MFWMTKKKQAAEEDRARDQEQFLKRLKEVLEVRPGRAAPPTAGAVALLLGARRGFLGAVEVPCTPLGSMDPTSATLLRQARERAQGSWFLADLMSGRVEDCVARQRRDGPEEVLAGSFFLQYSPRKEVRYRAIANHRRGH